MKPIVHAVAGATTLLLIAVFWTSTLVSEIFLDDAAVAAVKLAIVYGLFLLVPCMAATGGSGFALSKKHTSRLFDRKKTRMAIVGANGLLVMIPAAIFLNAKAGAGEFDTLFYTVQSAELIVGIVQIALLCLNFRDGRKLAGKLHASKGMAGLKFGTKHHT